MNKSRLEAFSDGVIAIILTIMVLEMKVPHSESFKDLGDLWPVFLSYILSYIYVGIYWTNHHHLFQAAKHVTGSVLWANLHLLFWLTLIPFVTGWMGENHFAEVPAALYGVVLFCASIAYFILVRQLVRQHGSDSTLARAVGTDYKGKISTAIYAISIPLSFVHVGLACLGYVIVACMWLIPDRRIERTVRHE